MNRYVFIDNYVAPFVIYPGDVFYLRGTSVCCSVVSVEGNIICYIMRHGNDEENVYVTRSEFESRFEFGYEGVLPETQQAYYSDGDDYSYEPYDWFEDMCHEADKYDEGYEN